MGRGNSSATSYHGAFYDPKPARHDEGACRSCGGDNVWPNDLGSVCCDCGEQNYPTVSQGRTAIGVAKRRYRGAHGLKREFD
jgi:hypothetical protein